jgi:TIR domain
MPVDTSDQATPDFLPRAHIVFVSHAGTDYELVAEKLLSELTHSLWDYHCENSLTRAGTYASDLYKKNILKSLSRCGACVVFLSRRAANSEWVKLEATSALNMKKPLFVHRAYSSSCMRCVIRSSATPARAQSSRQHKRKLSFSSRQKSSPQSRQVASSLTMRALA